MRLPRWITVVNHDLLWLMLWGGMQKYVCDNDRLDRNWESFSCTSKCHPPQETLNVDSVVSSLQFQGEMDYQWALILTALSINRVHINQKLFDFFGQHIVRCVYLSLYEMFYLTMKA